MLKLSELIGHHFVDPHDPNMEVYEIVSFDPAREDIRYRETSSKTEIRESYWIFKSEIETNELSFIDTFTYHGVGFILLVNLSYLFDKVELSNTPFGVASINNLPGGMNIVTSAPKCECGGTKIGVKDYQAGHAMYCPVHHDKNKTISIKI